MKITIFGTGYVGLVTGTCFADVGHDVCCVDIDQNKIDRLTQGEIPIYEPGLETLVLSNINCGRLSFTTSAKVGVEHGDIIFIAVGTPPKEDGSADLQYVLKVAEDIATHLNQYAIIVNKSTVPLGTADKVKAVVDAKLTERGCSDIAFEVCSNPEFLKEGAAIADFQKPDRIVVGHTNSAVEEPMRELYAPFNRNHDKLIFMDTRSAELTKYAANAMLATKISFINEIATIAERVGADVEQVRLGIGSDPRIGFHFIYAGCGYGGSCFPKDVKALAGIAAENNIDSQLLTAVDDVNEAQKHRMLDKVLNYYQGDMQGKKVAVWGLSFKPNTDDVREATSAVVIGGLLARGAHVAAFDPHAVEEFQRYNPDFTNISYVSDMMAALEDADCLVICTEWRNFWSPDFDKVKQLLKQPVIFDGRNIYNPHQMADLDIQYYGVGRGLSVTSE